MAAKRKATKAGAGAWATGKAVLNNPYVERLAGDRELRNNLRTAFESSRKAYARMANGRGPQAIVDDKKTQQQLRDAAGSLRDAAGALRGVKRRRKRRGGLVLFALVGVVAAVALNEGLRKKALDLLFGAEEEFEYTSSTAAPEPPPARPPAGPGPMAAA